MNRLKNRNVDDDPEEEAAADLHDGGQLLVRGDADPPEPRPVVVGPMTTPSAKVSQAAGTVGITDMAKR
jgi:hypothetical protein